LFYKSLEAAFSTRFQFRDFLLVLSNFFISIDIPKLTIEPMADSTIVLTISAE
jgi:hypothetical protein